MTRLSILVPAAMALTITLGMGCDKASDDQRKANSAQAEADQKIAEAKTEAITETTSAQIEADQKIAAAEGSFGKRREDYRHKVQSRLVELDKTVDVLEAKAKTAKGTAKTDLDLSLAQIRTRRAALATSFAAMGTTTALEWDGTTARVDKEWTELKAMVEKLN